MCHHECMLKNLKSITQNSTSTLKCNISTKANNVCLGEHYEQLLLSVTSPLTCVNIRIFFCLISFAVCSFVASASSQASTFCPSVDCGLLFYCCDVKEAFVRPVTHFIFLQPSDTLLCDAACIMDAGRRDKELLSDTKRNERNLTCLGKLYRQIVSEMTIRVPGQIAHSCSHVQWVQKRISLL